MQVDCGHIKADNAPEAQGITLRVVKTPKRYEFYIFMEGVLIAETECPSTKEYLLSRLPDEKPNRRIG